MIEALFSSKTRVKLLYLFYGSPDKSFYVREITRMVDEQINSVRRELSNMLDVGVIKSNQSDNKLFYTINADYEYFDALDLIFGSKSPANTSSSSRRIVKPVDDLGLFLNDLGDIKIVIYSGKIVRGSTAPVDVLIVGDASQLGLRRYIKNLEKMYDFDVNYTTISLKDFEYRRSIKDKFITNILNSKHRVVFDSTGLLTE